MGLLKKAMGAVKKVAEFVSDNSSLLDLGGFGLDFFGSRSAAKNAKRQFDSQMDYSIQRRVADARAAGIHPLFALGASVGASPTLSAGSNLRHGANLGEALNKRRETNLMREISGSEIRKNNAIAEENLALAAVHRQTVASQGRDKVGVMGTGDVIGLNQTERGIFDLVPAEVPTTHPKKPQTMAGKRPLFQDTEIHPGVVVPMIEQQAAEPIESLVGAWLLARGVTRNVVKRSYKLSKMMVDDIWRALKRDSTSFKLQTRDRKKTVKQNLKEIF